MIWKQSSLSHDKDVV